MKNKELINYLSTFNLDADVIFVSDFENDVHDDIIKEDFAWICPGDSDAAGISSDESKKNATCIMLIKEYNNEEYRSI